MLSKQKQSEDFAQDDILQIGDGHRAASSLVFDW